MKRFIFRNNTIEFLFTGPEYSFSGYDDISLVPDIVDGYIWFYQVPLLSDTHSCADEAASWINKLAIVASNIPKDKQFIVFTIQLVENLGISESNRQLQLAIDGFNKAAYDIANQYSNIKVLDISEFYNSYSSDMIVDWKMWFISQSPINLKLAKSFRNWFDGKIRAIEMRRKKCLVLDLDNTLWGGILGEDGIEGIKIGGDYPGKAFAWWQKALVELGKTGVILAVCSKNNETDVLEAWEKNPFMILKKEHISAYRINWQDKATNIRELAAELNIGIDSFVFIDDNPTERELIKTMLPEVSVPDFPTQPYMLPALYKEIIEDYFQIYSLTKEDIDKTRQYQANAQRAREQVKFTDFNEYLRSLEIVIRIEPANKFNVPRIAQMTQKTNQFNLTTRRYTEADIWKKIENGSKIWCLSVSDRFGDNGITGCIIVENNKIDTLLLSCRILGKGIEFAFLNTLLHQLKLAGIKTLQSEYIPTPKNSQVADFYDKAGFVNIMSQEGCKEYEIDLTRFETHIPEYYQISIKKTENGNKNH